MRAGQPGVVQQHAAHRSELGQDAAPPAHGQGGAGAHAGRHGAVRHGLAVVDLLVL